MPTQKYRQDVLESMRNLEARVKSKVSISSSILCTSFMVEISINESNSWYPLGLDA